MKQELPFKSGSLTRRGFHHVSIVLVPLAYGAAFLAAAIQYLLPLRGKKRLPRLQLRADPKELVEEKKVIRSTFNDREVFVLADEQGAILALDAKCPHLSCNVNWSEKENRFKCPCHGMTFTRGGKFIQGPTRKDLSPQSFENKNGKIILIDEGSGA